MARALYCYRCDVGDKDSVNREELNGVPDLHFVSKLNPAWTSFEWTSLWFMPNAISELAERVLKRNKLALGEMPNDLEMHQCEKGGGIVHQLKESILH